MVRSLTKRGMPKPVAIMIAALLALYFVPLSALPASATEPSLTLEGCRGSAASFPAAGPFVCPDAEYTSGNLQKEWNELDLVPFRITSAASAGDTFPFTTTLAADYKDKGNTGYDYISVPVVNPDLSDPSCQITNVGSLLYDQPSLGGSDATIRRDITWTQTTGTTCVFDYYQRLALGSSKYSGSNLQAYLGVDNGKKTVPLPVGAILPQKIDKTMTASQGSSYDWTLEKTATPSSIDFSNTCEQSTTPRSAAVTITLNWTRSAKLAAGDVLLTTKITATNPAHREITVNVEDKMYAGTTQTTLLATNTDHFDVPASGTHVFEFSETVSSSATTFNDVASATYTDKATGIAVPGNTTATAAATVTSNGQTSGASATIADVESITGAGFQFSVDSVSHGGDSATDGTFGGSYLLGTKASPVSWSAAISPAGTSAASGSYTFNKTVYVAAGTVGSGTLSDTATLSPAGQDAISKSKSVALTADAANPRLRITKMVDIAPTTDAAFTFLVRANDGQGNPTGSTYTFVVTIPAGQTSASSAYQTVAPSANGYLFTETAATGYTGVSGSIQALAKCAEYTKTVNNTRDLGKIKIKKTTDGDPAGASTDFTAHVNCPGDTYDQDVALNEGNGWVGLTGDIPTGTQCTITEVNIPAGWDLVSVTPGTVTVNKGTPESVSVVITNKRLTGGVVINKLRVGDAAGASTEFTVLLNCDDNTYDRSAVLNEANSWTKAYTSIPAGVTCAVTEPTVPTGWKLTSISPSGEFTIGSGASVVVNVTNTRELGNFTVTKVVKGDVAGASTDFTVDVNCDGTMYDHSDVALNSAGHWTATFTGIPTGVECQVTETDIPTGWKLTSISPAGKFRISDDKAVQVTVTNQREVGSLTVTKVRKGDVAGASTDFTVELNCDGKAYDQTIALNAGNGWTQKVDDIPTGVECQVTETDVPAGWKLTSISPAGKFRISDDKAVQVTVTNERLLGAVIVHKTVDGPVAGASTDFTAVLDCTGTAYDKALALTPANSWTAFAMDIPTGVSCAVTEPTVPAGWTLTSITPSGSFVIGGDVPQVSVEVVNTRDVGSVEVKKVVVGDVTGADTAFSVQLDCDGTAYDKTLALNSGNSWSARVDGIPTLTQCQVTEPTAPAGWSLTSIAPAGKFTVQKATAASVTVTNTRTTGVISVTKVLDGAANGAATSFTFDVDCVGTAYDQSVVVDVTSGTSATATTKAIPTGLTCTVTERAVPDWKMTSVVPAGGVVAVGSTVTFTNQRLQGTLNIAKAVSPVAGNGVVVNFGDTLTYTLTVSATGEQRQPNVVVTDYLPGSDPARPGSGKTTYVAGSAACVGAGTCTVTGPDGNGLITWSLGDMAAGTSRQVTFQVTIDDVPGEAGSTVAVDILNAGAVRSDRTPATPSNEVSTPVTKVLPVKVGKPPVVEPTVLPHTGNSLPVGPAVGAAMALLGLGLLLLVGSRRRSWTPRR